MAEAALEELEVSSSVFDYAVLQATDNSIPFYESLGFKRVGAVARYRYFVCSLAFLFLKICGSFIPIWLYFYILKKLSVRLLCLPNLPECMLTCPFVLVTRATHQPGNRNQVFVAGGGRFVGRLQV